MIDLEIKRKLIWDFVVRMGQPTLITVIKEITTNQIVGIRYKRKKAKKKKKTEKNSGPHLRTNSSWHVWDRHQNNRFEI